MSDPILLNETDIREVAEASPEGPVSYVASLFVPLAATILSKAITGEGSWLFAISLGIIIGLAACAINFVRLRKRMEQRVRIELDYARKSVERFGAVQLKVQSDGLTMTRRGQSNFVPWIRIRSWKELDFSFVIGGEIIPKRCMSGDEIAILRAGLENSRNMGD